MSIINYKNNLDNTNLSLYNNLNKELIYDYVFKDIPKVENIISQVINNTTNLEIKK